MRFLYLILLLTIVVSCDSDQLNEFENDIIINSVWVTGDDVKDFQLGGTNLQYLKFTSETDVIYQTERNGDLTGVTVGSYTYKYPLVEVSLNDEIFTYEFGFNDSELISKDLQQLNGEWLIYYRVE